MKGKVKRKWYYPKIIFMLKLPGGYDYSVFVDENGNVFASFGVAIGYIDSNLKEHFAENWDKKLKILDFMNWCD